MAKTPEVRVRNILNIINISKYYFIYRNTGYLYVVSETLRTPKAVFPIPRPQGAPALTFSTGAPTHLIQPGSPLGQAWETLS